MTTVGVYYYKDLDNAGKKQARKDYLDNISLKKLHYLANRELIVTELHIYTKEGVKIKHK